MNLLLVRALVVVIVSVAVVFAAARPYPLSSSNKHREQQRRSAAWWRAELRKFGVQLDDLVVDDKHQQQQQRAPVTTTMSCGKSDEQLNFWQQMFCTGMYDTPPGPVTPPCPVNASYEHIAGKSFPGQQQSILYLLLAIKRAGALGCAKTNTTRSMIAWVNRYQSNNTLPGTTVQSCLGQIAGYYTYPRPPPPARVESPDVLGEKCFALEVTTQTVAAQRAALEDVASKAGLTLHAFTAAVAAVQPVGHRACQRAITNCFVNHTYDPVKFNNTCPLSWDLFRWGFVWAKLQHGDKLNATMHYVF